jgi:hypothetical protein
MNRRLMVAIVALTVLGACRTAPIYNVNEAPVPVVAQKQATMDDVKGAILRAGARLGWQMTETGPRVINSRIALRAHTANADVKYTTKTYSIVYRDSTNLEATSGQIHKNYNGWVENLDREIRVELMRI